MSLITNMPIIAYNRLDSNVGTFAYNNQA